MSVNSRRGFDVLLPEAKEEAAAVEDDGADAPLKSTVDVPKPPSRFTVEEITSMILTHAKQFSEAVAGTKIKDALLVVPSYTTQNERLALVDSVELSGMKVCVRLDLGHLCAARCFWYSICLERCVRMRAHAPACACLLSWH